MLKEFTDFIRQNWPLVAAEAWNCYQEGGRCVTLLALTDNGFMAVSTLNLKELTGIKEVSPEFFKGCQKQLNNYDPTAEVVVLASSSRELHKIVRIRANLKPSVAHKEPTAKSLYPIASL